MFELPGISRREWLAAGVMAAGTAWNSRPHSCRSLSAKESAKDF